MARPRVPLTRSLALRRCLPCRGLPPLLLTGLRVDPLGQHLTPRRAVPLLVRLVGDLPGDQQLRELAPLGLALERHRDTSGPRACSRLTPHAGPAIARPRTSAPWSRLSRCASGSPSRRRSARPYPRNARSSSPPP